MRCYLGLGANIGNPAGQLAAAVSALAAADGVALRRVSSVYLTAPVGYADQPDFRNMVVAVDTALSPERLLEVTSGIESAMGRVRTIADGPRTIDIDILLCEGVTVQSARLQVPHPRMTQRQFVLVPLAEIAPDLPVAEGMSAGQLVRPGTDGVRCRGRLAELVRAEEEQVEAAGTEGS